MVDVVDAAGLGARAVEWRALEGLVPYARNARLHSKTQVLQIAASIERFGFNNPVLVDAGGEIVAGHGRVLAAAELGLTAVPVIALGHLSEPEIRAYRLADNRIAEQSKWDEEALGLELADLVDNFDVAALGFEDDEVERLVAEVAAQAGGDQDPAAAGGGFDGEDEAPEADETVPAVSRPGDLWVIAGHRVLCGDATDAAAVARLLDGAQPKLMVTDPFYGVEYDPDWRNRTAPSPSGHSRSARAVGTVVNDDRADWGQAYALFPGNVVYCWHSGKFGSVVEAGLAAAGFELRAQIIWAKHNHVISRGHYHFKHEPCWYAVRKGATAGWQGDRKQTSLWEIQHRKSDTGHGTQKPVEAMRRPILNHTLKGDAVYDPFLGSGTTLVACETEGRVGLGLEIAPAYVDVICRRLREVAGAPPILDGDGRGFEAVAAERGIEVAA